ncbi:oxidoreductase NAD-binding domain-containing protein 1 [Triangularia verruculosa]|uniref:Oxidoreductase NAD-binding domain-containing protein 1 n=1 Tax=Triangularia verruculosa TaxID=2587418 RepID=A0AAN6XST6_9PEZI|nr:oxidoreductase NAD-binding domain-containing protein 1 [Triangularia verruculosa]
MCTKTTHIDRTAHEPRDNSLYTLLISGIIPITPTIRLFHLSPPPCPSPVPQQPIHFLPGQWVDLYYPPFPPHQKPGGFTITSPPSSLPNYIELAIQSAPSNPPAAYLWKEPPESLLNTPVRVRIGGSFTYPPPPSTAYKKVIFVAGGVGINPIMGMLSHIASLPALEKSKKEVVVLYGMKDSDGVIQAGTTAQALFLDRIAGLFAGEDGLRGGVELFLTGSGSKGGEAGGTGDQVIQAHGVKLPFTKRRIVLGDLEEAIGAGKDEAAVYICGVPSMTDELVEGLTSPTPKGLGMDKRRVLCEKWW